MIQRLATKFAFEEPRQFTDPFRYIPHPTVREAARCVIERIEADPDLATAFSEGKMLGVLVCRQHDSGNTTHIDGRERLEIDPSGCEGHLDGERDTICYIAAFSGNVGGRSQIEGFVPPIYDLLNPEGEFKRREAEISELNHRIEELLDSDRLLCLERELADAQHGSEVELTGMKEVMAVSKARREKIRENCTDPDILDGLIKESQYEKAEYRRLKKVLDELISSVRERIALFHGEIESMKKQRSTMSESLQNWIFKQYIVHNATGESSSIADIFAAKGLVPPGGTGECAAPKLLEYAFRNGLEPLAMGEFWYGRSPETAVRTHGHFYPSCTSKCGPLLGYMLRGMSTSEWPMIPKTPAFTSVAVHCKGPLDHLLGRSRPLAGGGMSSTSSGHSDVEQTVQPIQIPEPITLYEDEAMIVVEKPSGMPSVPGLDGRVSLLEWLSSTHSTEPLSVIPSQDSSAISSERNETRHLHVVHRLDMDTSGVMVFAKTHEAAINLRRQFEEHTVRKTYMARVNASESYAWQVEKQSTEVSKGSIDLPLSADYDERPRQKVDFKQGKAARTDYEIVEANQDGTADLLLYPHTGRTHQLRVHCAHTRGLGRPILGDLLYGAYSVDGPKSTCPKKGGNRHSCLAKPSVPERLCLHALSITFRHPHTGERLSFTSRQLCY